MTNIISGTFHSDTHAHKHKATGGPEKVIWQTQALQIHITHLSLLMRCDSSARCPGEHLLLVAAFSGIPQVFPLLVALPFRNETAGP